MNMDIEKTCMGFGLNLKHEDCLKEFEQTYPFISLTDLFNSISKKDLVVENCQILSNQNQTVLSSDLVRAIEITVDTKDDGHYLSIYIADKIKAELKRAHPRIIITKCDVFTDGKTYKCISPAKTITPEETPICQEYPCSKYMYDFRVSPETNEVCNGAFWTDPEELYEQRENYQLKFCRKHDTLAGVDISDKRRMFSAFNVGSQENFKHLFELSKYNDEGKLVFENLKKEAVLRARNFLSSWILYSGSEEFFHVSEYLENMQITSSTATDEEKMQALLQEYEDCKDVDYLFYKEELQHCMYWQDDYVEKTLFKNASNLFISRRITEDTAYPYAFFLYALEAGNSKIEKLLQKTAYDLMLSVARGYIIDAFCDKMHEESEPIFTNKQVCEVADAFMDLIDSMTYNELVEENLLPRDARRIDAINQTVNIYTMLDDYGYFDRDSVIWTIYTNEEINAFRESRDILGLCADEEEREWRKKFLENFKPSERLQEKKRKFIEKRVKQTVSSDE